MSLVFIHLDRTSYISFRLAFVSFFLFFKNRLCKFFKMADLAFLVTPGLAIFLSIDTANLIAASSEITLFYSVTVLLLIGHLPFAMCVGLVMMRNDILVSLCVVSVFFWSLTPFLTGSGK
jgi:hypothetical protein